MMSMGKTASSLAVLAALLSIHWASPVKATWIHDGTAICTATGNQTDYAIASDDSGSAFVVWVDYRSGNGDVYVQKVSASGDTLWTGDGVLLCTAAGDQWTPAIISDGAGGAIVTWEDYRIGSSDIYAQRLDTSGAAQWTGNGVAICTATGYQHNPTITSDGSGGAIVAWPDTRTGGSDIYAQRVDSSGVVQWIADGVALCTAATGSRWGPTIVSDGTGGAIVAWNDDRGSAGHDTYAQRINASGAVQWTVDGVALCTATGDQIYPQATSDGSGGATVAWMDERGTDLDIYVQRIDTSGTVQWTPDGVPLCSASQAQYGCTITRDNAGGAIVAWTDERNGGMDETDIYAQRVDAFGVVQWTANGVAVCTAAGGQLLPGMVPDGSNGAVLTWEDWRNGVDSDIYAQRIDASGTAQWTVNGVALCTASEQQEVPVIASDGAGGGIAAWDDARSGTYLDIYAQRVTHLGNIGGDYVPILTLAVIVIALVVGSLGVSGLRRRRTTHA